MEARSGQKNPPPIDGLSLVAQTASRTIHPHDSVPGMTQSPNKLTVFAFKDKRLEKSAGDFVLPVNPEQFAQTHKVEYDVKPAQGAQGVEGRFKSAAPEELKLDFVFDGTGTIYGYAHSHVGQSVPDQIAEFKNVVYDLQGDIHQPKYLKLVWKDFTFDCILTELQVTYTLFDPEGTPLRAKLSCTFLNYKETERRVREENKNSPDLTHLRTVREQDTLPLMTDGIYDTPTYYLEVARANDLTNFRRLSVNAELVFPPVAKTRA